MSDQPEPIPPAVAAVAQLLYAAIAKDREAREALLVAIFAEPEAVQRAIAQQLGEWVAEEKHNEAGAINYNGIRAQVEYLSEDGEAFPPEAFAELIEAARRVVQS